MGNLHRNALKQGYKLHWYEVKTILGQGGFGITYLAYDTNLDKDVAIKEYLPIELAVREGDESVQPVTEDRNKNYKWGLDRFIKEAQTLAKFTHPNIVRVHSVFEENNTAYMVMEYEHGESFQDILSRRKTLEEAELLSILIPVIGGLQLVHDAGFIHRDIKPANIFIRKDGSPVLLDFGSARQALGEQTKTLTSLVSPGYAPFEQYYSKGEDQGPWTDIYGLGATFYRAIAGVAPMDAVDRSKSILERSKDIFVPAIEVGKGRYTERFLKAIDHALKFNSQERPQSLSQWKAEFGIKDDLNEIKQLQIMEEQVTQPGTKLVRKQTFRLRPLPVTVLILFIFVLLVFYFHENIQEYINTYLPEIRQAEVIEIQPSPDEMVISKQQAREKKEQLEKEQEIQKLLSLAKEDFDAGRLIDPPGLNALDHYLNILEIEPENTPALEGRQTIFQHFIDSAESLVKDQKFDEADRALLKADITIPDSRDVKLVRLRLKETRSEYERTAKEEEQRRQEQELKQQEEEQRLKAAEEKRLAELEKKRQQEEQKKIEEQKKLEEEKREAEQARLAELERERLEKAAAAKKAEEDKKQKYNFLIADAQKAISNKDRDLAISKFKEALQLYPDGLDANTGLKTAENLKHKLCYEVQGLWIWDKPFGQDTMVLNDNGTIDYQTVIKGSGSWECTNPEGRIIKIRLSAGGFSNEWLSEYSTDGTCLTGPQSLGGSNCYHRSETTRKTVAPETGQQVKTEPINVCSQIIGVWKWSDLAGSVTRFYEGGKVVSKNLLRSEGNWKCIDPDNRLFTFNTFKKLREIIMNEDFKTIRSVDVLGNKIIAEKLSDDPAEEIQPRKSTGHDILGR